MRSSAVAWLRGAALASLTVLAAMQFVPGDRPVRASRGAPVAPAAVEVVLRHACYDCHSNETAWPWYTSVAPLSWLADHDVSEGRRRLNFSEWDAYASDPSTLAHKRSEIAARLEHGDMAPWYYRLVHPGARLTQAERELLVRWAAGALTPPPT